MTIRITRKCEFRTNKLPRPTTFDGTKPLESDWQKSDQLVGWLQSQKHYYQKPAKDVLSRCRRAERFIGRPLATLIREGKSVPDILIEIKAGANRQGLPPEQADRAMVSLRTAIRAYYAYETGT